MANATVGTVNALVTDGSLADPAGETLDTGTTAVTLKYDVAGVTSNILFRVKNTGAHSATFTVAAGDYPPAFRQGVGALAVTVAAGATTWVGPFGSARFIKSGTDAGKLAVTFTPSGGDTIAGTITCLQVPKA